MTTEGRGVIATLQAQAKEAKDKLTDVESRLAKLEKPGGGRRSEDWKSYAIIGMGLVLVVFFVGLLMLNRQADAIQDGMNDVSKWQADTYGFQNSVERWKGDMNNRMNGQDKWNEEISKWTKEISARLNQPGR